MVKKPGSDQFDIEASTDKWRLAGLILMALFFLAFPLFRLYEPAQRADAREAQIGYLAAEGSELFETNCSECHGRDGAGAIAPAIGSKEFLESVDDTQISQLTALGVPGTEMVAYSNDLGGPLTSQEITAITTYLRSLEEEAFSMVNWRTPLENEALTGQELFVLACSRCHGVDAGGVEDVGPDISQDSFTLMESDDFIIGRITEGYKLMPRFGRTLTDAQIASIVTYLRFGDNPPQDTTTTTTTTPGNGNGSGNGGQDGSTTTVPSEPEVDPAVLAQGERLFQEIAGGRGCQECHGRDGKGTSNGPHILGAGRSAISRGLNGGIPDMDFQTRLTNEEIDAVYEYLLTLRAADQAAGGSG
jgi:mono/diheme cytochrome c family protein